MSWCKSVLLGGLLLVGAVVCGQGAGARAAEGRFTDVTAESGIGRILADHYAKHPDWWLSGLHLIDLDGDGHLDFVTGTHGAGEPLAALGDGRGHFTVASGYRGTEVRLAADLNEDGRVDLLMNHGDGGGRWWINESEPGRVRLRDSGVSARGPGQARANALVDLDRDGRIDWLHEKPGVCWELGDGRGGFRPGGHVPSGAVRHETNVHYGDLRGTGRVDLVLHWGRYENERGRSRVLLSDGQGGFADATREAGLSEEDGLAVKGLADVDQDGRPDLLVLEGREAAVYLNDGQGRFRKRAGAIEGLAAARRPHQVSWGLATVADFDNDGVADVLWNGRHFLWVLRGLGGGRFQYVNAAWGIDDYAAASVDDGLCFGDIDGDGDLDVIGYAGGPGPRRVKVYRNDLPPQHWIRVRPVGAPGNLPAAGAVIRILEAGRADRPLWCEQVQIVGSQSAHTYYALARTERHFGLGRREAVDVVVEFHPSGRKVEARGVRAGTTVVVREDGGAEGRPPAAP